VWERERPAVEDELKEILGVDELRPGDPEYFQKRTTAVKRVYDKMTEQERMVIQNIVEERKAQGNPPNIQREYVFSCCTTGD
jgi:hypothetical protein